jgi:hypothetical protein
MLELARLRATSRAVKESLFCSGGFAQRPVIGDRPCAAVLNTYAPKQFRRLILEWLTAGGPFLEDDRWPVVDDYFEFEGHDVTEQGLGEAARRIGSNQTAGVFSFLNGLIDFEREPLTVQHGLAEEPLRHIAVDNVWQAAELERRTLASLPTPSTWAELLATADAKFPRLLIAPNILAQLRGNPFYPSVSDRATVLLSVLQEYMADRRVDGSEGAICRYIREQHFVGDLAWFTDESDRNKIDFRRQMTFPDPEEPNRTIFCPWHGKIRTQQFRIHFEWPVPVGQERLKIVYVGPKLTRR